MGVIRSGVGLVFGNCDNGDRGHNKQGKEL